MEMLDASVTKYADRDGYVQAGFNCITFHIQTRKEKKKKNDKETSLSKKKAQCAKKNGRCPNE